MRDQVMLPVLLMMALMLSLTLTLGASSPVSHSDGSVAVFHLFEPRTENNAITEGPRKAAGVTEKDSKKYGSTGGWGFEGFKGDTKERAVTGPKHDCFTCHTSQKGKDYVFSGYRK